MTIVKPIFRIAPLIEPMRGHARAALRAIPGISLKTLKVCLLSGLGYCCQGAASAEAILDIEAGVLFDSNLGNGQFEPDVHSDFALVTSISAGQSFYPGDAGSLSATLDAKSQIFNRFSGMSNLSLGGTLALRRKMGLGAAAPWLSAAASATRLDFANDVRSGWLYRAGIAAGKRLTERWDLRAEYAFERRTGDQAEPADPERSGAVFDLMNRILSVTANYAYRSDTLLQFGYTRRVGDAAVTTTVESATIDFVSTAETADTAFGTNATAYKLHAASNNLFLGVSKAVNPHASININLQRQLTHGDGGNNYNKSVFAATYYCAF